MRLPPAWILVTPGDVGEAERARVPRLVERCLPSGLAGVLLREPAWGDRALLEVARALRGLIADGWLAVHDRVHVAAAAEADAVHLGWRSLAPAEVRAFAPRSLALGFSAHASDAPGAYASCNYAFYGPVHDTPSKRGLVAPVGIAGLERAVRATSTPLWALGGVRPDDVTEVLAAGAAGFAVLGGIARAPDPVAACRAYAAALSAARAEGEARPR